LNLTRLHLGIAHESQFQGLGIRWRRRRPGDLFICDKELFAAASAITNW
jgi:hypothetical protein